MRDDKPSCETGRIAAIADTPPSPLIHSRFEAEALRRPDALAVSSGDVRLTYRDLDRLSARLAARLLDLEAAPGAVTAIWADRGAKLVVAVLACARVGRPFVVLDRAYPTARLRTLIDISRPAAMIQASEVADAPDLGLTCLTVDLVPDDGADPHPVLEPRVLSPDAPAYLLFTSGSTGTPKCVACSHRPLVNFVQWQARTFDLGPDDRFTLLSGLSHDPILRDLFTPLSLGASIHIPTQGLIAEPGGLRRWFGLARPTVAHMTPPLGLLLTAAARPADRLDPLRYVFFGGDVLRQTLVEAVTRLAPGCESVNVYGATETPQAVSYCRVKAGSNDARAPIGTAVDGFVLEVVDEAGRVRAPGQEGEIVVRSAFLALGYVENGRLPTGSGQAETAYATGDIGVQRPDGQIEILGRRDDQVKVRGYRVELAEITSAALGFEGVEQSVTLNLGDATAVRLGCFVAPAPGRHLDGSAVSDHIAARLPAHMTPDTVLILETLPLLPNGKVDRQALVRHAAAGGETGRPPPESLPATPVETALVAHWRQIFGRETITRESSFTALGGDSLSYVNAYLALEEVIGVVPDGWASLTIAELAASKPARSRSGLFTTVESGVLMRAAAICAVVASHFQLIFSGGAATSALIFVSGFLFGRLQLREADSRSTMRPMLRLLRGILIPLALIEAPQLAVKFLKHYHFKLSSVFLYTDLLDYTGMDSSGVNAYGGNEYVMWYLHCIIHIIIAYAVLLLIAKYVFRFSRPGLFAVFAAVILGVIGRFAAPTILVPGFWEHPIDPMSYYNHAPTTHLATFALAALAGFLDKPRRWVILGAALVYAIVSAIPYGQIDSVAVVGVAGALLFLPKITTLRVLVAPIYQIAGASFFIYLLHFKFLVLFGDVLGLPRILALPATLAAGVLVWRLWTLAAQWAGRGGLGLLIRPRSGGARRGRPKALTA